MRSVGGPTSQPCIVCASPNIVPILEIPAIPTDTIRLWSSRAAACSALKARMGLTYCENCGHLFNRHYDNDLVDYETDYENSQMFSPRFRRYAEELSDRLITTYHLHQKDIVEIGGGRGDFLRIICDRGNNNGVSFGPSYRPAAGDSVPVNVRFVTDYYTAKYAAAPANLIVCRHVLEHFWEPRTLIDTVRQAVGDRKDLVVYFEVPNGEFILREQMFWEIIFQHPSYFTESSLAKLFTMCGFSAGRFTVAGSERGIDLRALAEAARDPANLPDGMTPGPDADAYNDSDVFTFPNGCHTAEIEIDLQTGAVTLERYQAIDDYGRLINPMLTKGQVQGGLAQGIGQALLEHTVYEGQSGQLLSGSFLDYALPRADDLPSLDITLAELPTAVNQLGVKGAGQAGCMAAPQTIINAILDALAPLGIAHIDMPATPERVWRAIRSARAG